MVRIIIVSILAVLNAVLGLYNICNGNIIGFFNIGVAIWCIIAVIIIAEIERTKDGKQ